MEGNSGSTAAKWLMIKAKDVKYIEKYRINNKNKSRVGQTFNIKPMQLFFVVYSGSKECVTGTL